MVALALSCKVSMGNLFAVPLVTCRGISRSGLLLWWPSQESLSPSSLPLPRLSHTCTVCSRGAKTVGVNLRRTSVSP